MAVPTWETQQLDQLSAEGLLSGVSPVYLSAIDLEESAGAGGGINPQGYGGFFGLGQSSTYPAGTSSPTLLSDPSVQSFDAQAVLAASSFASDLSKTAGDPLAAEGIYQTGSPSPPGGPSGGQTLFQSLGLGSPLSGPSSPANATDASVLSGLGNVISGAAGIGAGGLASPAAGAITSGIVGQAASTLGPLLARIFLYVAFVAGGIVLVILGLQRLTGAKASFPIPIPV